MTELRKLLDSLDDLPLADIHRPPMRRPGVTEADILAGTNAVTMQDFQDVVSEKYMAWDFVEKVLRAAQARGHA